MHRAALYLALLVALVAPRLSYAQSDEDKIYNALKGSVRRVESPFTVFHWERTDTEFGKKFNLDDSRGVVDMVQTASRSFIEQDAKKGFYTATDPVASRAFGYGNWRLIQMEVPEGWKYLDISSEPDLYGRLAAVLPEDAPCLSSMLISNNHKGARGISSELNAGKCNALKQKVFRRLGVSGVKYTWVPPGLDRYCRGRDRSAFIITNGSWISSKNIKAYTVDSRGSDSDRKAIQELVLTIQPPQKYKKTVPAPLWNDLTKEKGISDTTREWMRAKLLNCREMGGQEEIDESSDEERIVAPAN